MRPAKACLLSGTPGWPQAPAADAGRWDAAGAEMAEGNDPIGVQ
jgi:hypothetical protein